MALFAPFVPFDSEIWNPAIETYGNDLLFITFFISELVIYFGMVSLAFVTCISFFKKKGSFIKNFKLFLYGTVVSEFILNITQYEMYRETVSVSELIRTLVYFFIWYAYINKSRRVKITFTNE